jgi:hypothetical protein
MPVKKPTSKTRSPASSKSREASAVVAERLAPVAALSSATAAEAPSAASSSGSGSVEKERERKKAAQARRRSPPTVKKNPLPQPLPTSQSLPNLALASSSPIAPPSRPADPPVKAKKRIIIELRGESEDEEEEEERRRLATGLSTPPLSKGVSKRFSPVKSVLSRSMSTPPSVTQAPVLPVISVSKKRRQEETDDDDPLLLSSPAKPATTSPIIAAARAATPRMSLPPTGSRLGTPGAGGKRMSFPGRKAEEEENESEDELML